MVEKDFCKNCGNKLKNGKCSFCNKEKSFVSSWLKIGSYILIGLSVLTDIIYGGYIIGSVVGGLIAIWCGNRCSKWAVKIKKSPNWAYVIGFCSALLGLLIYYIYYKMKIAKKISLILKIIGWVAISFIILVVLFIFLIFLFLPYSYI